MTTTLAAASLGLTVVVASAPADPALARRLAEMGLRIGMPVRPLTRTTGGGRVVDVAGARLALGADVLAGVLVTPRPEVPADGRP